MNSENSVCCKCGKAFSEMDKWLDFKIDTTIGYGSRYDLCKLKVSLCVDCLDELVEYLKEVCAINPLIEED